MVHSSRVEGFECGRYESSAVPVSTLHMDRSTSLSIDPSSTRTFFCLWKVMRPHRRQPVCVLVWRLPKLEVPFVMVPGNQVSLFPVVGIVRCGVS